jgi:uncharacterized membrane protein
MTQTDFTIEDFPEKDITSGNLPNALLTAHARETLSNCWGKAIQATLLHFGLAWGVSLMLIIPFVIVMTLSHFSGADVKTVEELMQIGMRIIQILLAGAFALGLARYFLLLSRKSKHLSLGEIFYGFRHFGTALSAYLQVLTRVLIGFILFIIPGIILSYRYALVYFILAEDSDTKVSEALKQSAKLMRGKKWKFFCLQCRFIGWSILTLFTLGIGYLWLIPYMQTSFAKFYDDLLHTQPSDFLETEITDMGISSKNSSLPEKPDLNSESF